MRKVVYGLVGLVVFIALVAVAALLIVPGLIDWNPYKDRIVAEARDLLGRDLQVDGRIGFTILPAPALSVGQVKIANIDGGTAPHMAEVEALRVRVALLPLIGGSIEVEAVSLVEPSLVLEILADGRRNWIFATSSETGTADAATDGTAQPSDEGFFQISQARIESFSVTGGTLVYRDARTGREERVEDLEAAIAAESLIGPVTATGAAKARGVAIDFDFGLGRVVRSGAIPFNVTFDMPEAEARIQTAGSLSNQPDTMRLRAQVKAEGADFGRLLGQIDGTGESKGGPLAQPFLLEAEITGDEALLEGKELTLRLGEASLAGNFAAKTGASPELSLDLRAGRIDLDAFLASSGESDESEATGTVRNPPDQTGPTKGPAPNAWSPPNNLRVDLALLVEGAVYRGQALRQITLEAALDDGVLTIDRARAQLPAGSELSLTATAAFTEGTPSYDALVTLTSENVRSLAEWLGADLSAVPSSRLRRFDFSGRIHGDAAQLNLADLAVTLDLTKITGGLVAALRDRPGLGIGLAIDSVNLDAYLPVPSLQTADGAPSGDAGVGTDEDAPAEPPVLAWLDLFDANLDLRLGSLTTGGTKLANLKLDGTWRDGALTVREASIGELAGGRADFAGRVEAFESPPRVDGTLDLRVSDPLRLAKAVGLEPATLGRLGPFGLTTALRGSFDSLSLDSELTALDGRFGFTGTLEPAARPLAFDMAVTARHPDLAGLLAALDVEPRLGAGLGGLDLKGRVAGTPLAFAVSDLIGTAGPLDVKGGLSADFAGPAAAVREVDLDLHLVHDDLGGLAEALGGPPPAGRDLGSVDLRAKLTGDHLRPALGDLAGRLGPVVLTSGTFGADLSGDRPKVDADLEANTLPLAALAAPAAGGRTKDKNSSRRRWSTEPIDLAALRAFDGSFDIRAKLLTHDKLRIEDARIEAALADGLFDLRRLTGTLAGGALQVSGKVTAGSPVTAGFAVTAIEVDAKPLLKALADFNRLSGPVTLEGQFSSEGGSEAQLVAGLTGSATVEGKLRAKTKSEERVGALALGLLGAEVKKVENLSQATLLLFSSFADTPADLTGSFTAANGVIRTEDLRLVGRGARINTRGQARLPAWNLDATSVVFDDEQPNKPTLTLRLEGPLDDPTVKVVGLTRQRREEAPAPEQPATEEVLPGVTVPEDLKPEDVIKNLLKGLGN